jgi:hypothetical protein
MPDAAMLSKDMTDAAPTAVRRLRLRYSAVCAMCGIKLSAGAQAFWNRAEKTATCLSCAPDSSAPDTGTPGASAKAEGDRRMKRRVEDVRRRFGDHAAAVAEHMASRDVERSWGKGSSGESRLAAFIAREVGDSAIALHDRLIPGTRGNIDHIFVSASGVWVVDAKSYKGKVELREHGPIWRREAEVYVAGRKQTALTRGVKKQVESVRAALRGDPEAEAARIVGALCFVDSDWGLLDSPFWVDSIWVTYPGALRKSLKKRGALSRETMGRIARRLDLSLPSAAP